MSSSLLNEIFHDTSQRFSDKPCIVYVSEHSQKCVSYGHMKTLVEQIISVLKKCGISQLRNQFIGITGYGLSTEIVALLIGIMDTKNAFVFLDTSSSYVLKIVQNLKIRWLIGEQHFVENSNSFTSFKLLETFKILESYYCIHVNNCEDEYSRTEYQFAFAVMSSGSTGEPKIIKVPHNSIVPNIVDLKEIFEMVPEDIMYLTTPLTFDPCIVDLFLAFYTGASILFPSRKIQFDSKFLLNIFTRVTIWYTTPSLFIKSFPKQIERSNLRILILGGEHFPVLDFRTWSSLKNVKIFNIYGITEVSCWASIYFVEDPSKPVPLGNTLSDTTFQIRDENGDETDCVGELFIGSKRRKCVVNDDFSILNEELFFRPTGDLVKISNGKYYYVGRKDRRIKLFGHIVDLSEIEAHILKEKGIEHCCCVFIQDENKIVAFIELKNGNFDTNELDKLLRAKLPSVMIPSDIYTSKIPLNNHGKICEKSCRELYSSVRTKLQNFSSEFENLWKKYTTNNKPVIDSNRGFISCGGNSIFALQFTTVLANFCQVPEDFIAFLLLDKSYDSCFQLIQSRLYRKTENNATRIPQMAVKRIDAEEQSSSSSKKLKIFNYAKCIRVKGKNFPEDHYVFEDGVRPTTLKIHWKYNLEKCVDASPSVVVFEDNLSVICGSHSGDLVMLNVPSGTPCLKMRLPDRIESSASVSSCGKFFFIGCYDKKLYCININENSIQWYFQTDDIVKSTPALFKNRLYFGSYDHNFYCLSSESGSLIWKHDIDKSSIYATPIVTDDYIIVTTLGGTVAAFNHNGTIKHSTTYGKPFFSNPLKLPTKEEFIVIDVTGVMRLIKMDTGYKICEYHTSNNVFSSVTIIDYSADCKITFGCYDKNVYCFQVLNESLHLTWKKELEANIYSTPFAFGNSLSERVPCKYQYIAVTCITGSIYIIESDNGNSIMSFNTFGPIFSSPVVHRSYLMIGCRDNFLYCFKFG